MYIHYCKGGIQVLRNGNAPPPEIGSHGDGSTPS